MFFRYRGEGKKLRQLADYAIKSHFPTIQLTSTKVSLNPDDFILVKLYPLPEEDTVYDRTTPTSNVEIENDKSISLTVELNCYAQFFREVVKKTAIMIAHWQVKKKIKSFQYYFLKGGWILSRCYEYGM